MSRLPRVAVISTGGTIDSVGSDRLDLAWYIEAQKTLGPGQLLAHIPEVAAIAQVHEVPFRRKPSHMIVEADWLDLVRKVNEIFMEDEADGTVITHGTNTLEETAYFLNLTVKSHRPIVVVGAMRPASALSSDGPLNLLNAIRVAAASSSNGAGVLVVLNDAIHAARDVTKSSTYRLETFQSRDLGPLGFADADGEVVYYRRVTRRHTLDTEFDVSKLRSLPRVDVVTSYVGADGGMIDAAVAAGARGIVSAGSGAGRPAPLEEEALSRAHEKGVSICQASRVGSGRSVRSPRQCDQGFVAADNLQPWKARILLALALTKTTNPDEIQRIFDTY